jgi:tape measure domain-containing protein
MAISTTFTLKFAGAAVERGLARVQSAFKSLGGVAMKVGKSLLSPFAALTALLGAGALTAGLVSFVKGSSEAAASIEDLTMQFEVLTKSASVTKGMLDDFRKEAAKSPLSIEDYAKAGKTLMAFGLQAKDVMPTLKNLADVSMGNSDRFGSLALAFAQTTAAGRLMGQEVLQFVNAGFNPLQQISKKTGESMVQLKKRMEDGAISALEVKQAFKEATSEGGLFFGAIQKGAETTSGKIAKTKDAILGVKIAFGTGFNDGLRVALDAMGEGIPKLEGKATEMGNLLGMSISDAVNGDITRFVMIGSIIGDAIGGGLKIAFSEAWQQLGGFMNTRRNFITGEVNQEDAKKQEQDRQYLRESMGSELIEKIRTQYKDAIELPSKAVPRMVPGAEGFRYAQPNEPATMMNGERVVNILSDAVRELQAVNQKLSPQP